MRLFREEADSGKEIAANGEFAFDKRFPRRLGIHAKHFLYIGVARGNDTELALRVRVAVRCAFRLAHPYLIGIGNPSVRR